MVFQYVCVGNDVLIHYIFIYKKRLKYVVSLCILTKFDVQFLYFKSKKILIILFQFENPNMINYHYHR